MKELWSVEFSLVMQNVIESDTPSIDGEIVVRGYDIFDVLDKARDRLSKFGYDGVIIHGANRDWYEKKEAKENDQNHRNMVVNWIPCAEKLPCEKDGKVLISMPNGEVMIGKYSEFGNVWFKGDMCGVGGDDPIAWMPMLEPYQVRQTIDLKA